MSRRPVIDAVEGMVRGMIEKGVPPHELMIGIHNAFAHGECLKKAGLEFTDQQLGAFYDGIGKAQGALREIWDANQ